MHSPASPVGASAASDVQAILDARLPALLVRRRDDVRAIGGTYQLRISGVGSWHIDLECPAPHCTRAEAPSDCEIATDAEDFHALCTDSSAGMRRFFNGKLAVVGNQLRIIQLAKLLSLM